MTLAALALAGRLLLAADPVPAQTAAAPLPRSSIAAVLEHRGELDLTDAESRELERRDDALAKQQDDLREQFPASHRGGGSGAGGQRPGQAERGAQPLSPTASALPEGTGGGGRRGGGPGGGHRGEGRSSAGAQDPAARAAALQSKLDDADTAAWLSAENVLDPSRRERARDVAEKYREALADQREADRKAHAHP
jgi:hypothetical protein